MGEFLREEYSEVWRKAMRGVFSLTYDFKRVGDDADGH